MNISTAQLEKALKCVSELMEIYRFMLGTDNFKELIKDDDYSNLFLIQQKIFLKLKKSEH